MSTDQTLPPPPRELVPSPPVLKRVGRPLRHVKHIPVKSLVFRSKTGPLEFSYDKKIKTPVPKGKLVVEVHHVGLNPVDMKIRNGYLSGTHGEIGLGREFAGRVSVVGEALQDEWEEGEDVYGIYYHPRTGLGALQSSILVNPKSDILIRKPQALTSQEASASLWCLGTAYNILDMLDRGKYLKIDSSVLINGGTSSVGMFAIQLLKYHYKLNRKLVIVTAGTGSEFLREKFSDVADDFLFIDYLSCRGKSSKPLRQMIQDEQLVDYDPITQREVPIPYKQGKFDIVLDFIGGYDILSHSSDLIHSGGAYVTTVGDYVANYSEDIYNNWDNPSANARKLFGSMIWSYKYWHYNFDPTLGSASRNDWINKCNQLLENGTVRPIISKVYDWKETKEALSYMATQRSQGKLVLVVERF